VCSLASEIESIIITMAKATLGIILGNRDFFPDQLVDEARRDVLALCQSLDVEPVLLDPATTKLGAVETWAHAKACAELFARNRDRIDGVLVSLPNFGDEKGIADALRLSDLRVPVLVQAYPDDLHQLNVERRHDGFCGKISVCHNLRQYGIPFSLTERHTVHPSSPAFQADLERFLAVCRVVRGLRRARIGAIGARPNAFNTTRYSEKLFEASGISVSTIDLSEILENAKRLDDRDLRVKQKLAEIGAYAAAPGVPDSALVLMAKLGAVVSEWMGRLDLDASAIQCWSSLQQNYGVNSCTIMSMMSEKLMPSARAVVEVPGLQALMRFICRNGFEHHAAMNGSSSAAVLAEAFERYFDWGVHHHAAGTSAGATLF
jgi:L-fucose isomerase-like protein